MRGGDARSVAKIGGEVIGFRSAYNGSSRRANVFGTCEKVSSRAANAFCRRKTRSRARNTHGCMREALPHTPQTPFDSYPRLPFTGKTRFTGAQNQYARWMSARPLFDVSENANAVLRPSS